MSATCRVALTVAIVLVVSDVRSVEACPVCFGGDASPLLDAARLGVLTLALVTVGVLGAFARWFLRLRALASREHDQ